MLGRAGIPKFQKHKMGGTTKKPEWFMEGWTEGKKERGQEGEREAGRKGEQNEGGGYKNKNCKNFKGTPKQTAIPWRRTATSLAKNQ